ncbi:glucan biosynthesis protein D [Altererythrobacter endophyticus]|uniref:Glucan biosynthesis protein D n=2 Tax=Altericroceibacterium endophyticum TaxID=1808508 RepID=A0A6I4T5K4_9SPHN|nr:glucan biosynthesis protein D [Altericroceibacterium endophyticum]
MAHATPAGALGKARRFSWEELQDRARHLAARPYRAGAKSTHLASDYDESVRLTYGQAEFLGDNIRLFPATAAVAEQPVGLHLLQNGMARPLMDSRGLFADGGTADPAGFRVMDAGQPRDWLAFLGASYFRSAGADNQYGLSARGIAVDTGLARAEEFPRFSDFWIEELGPDQTIVYALLDGPSLSGAYRFDNRKGPQGVTQDVSAVLFMRKDIERLGVAPASSMFWYDQSAEKRIDWRPEIHDSDGLAIFAANGERVFRPLINPPNARISVFNAPSPAGFGLIQRDRNFAHYQDDGAFYEKRPDLWVEPQGEWGAGAVMLYEMPTASETADNIAAFWTPDAAPRAGERRDYAYRLHWVSADPSAWEGARLVHRWQGAAGIPGALPTEHARKYVFDFAGPNLAGLTRQSGLVADTNLPEDRLLHSAAFPVAGQDSLCRVTLDIALDGKPPSEFRLYLRQGDDALSETVIQPLLP